MIFYTYRKQKNENFMKKLKRENSDNINQNKKEEREIILNKYIQSTNNYGIKKKINFFENNIYKNNNKNNQEKYFEKINYRIKTENIKNNFNKKDNNFINNLMQKKGENNEEYFKDEMLNEIENLNIVKNYKDLSNNLNYRNNSKN